MNNNLNIIRNAVRCFYIKDNKVIGLKTKETNIKPGFFDIPGGKIEDGETMEEAAIREYKEETGLNIENPIYRGIINVVFPKGTYRLNTFIVNSFSGELQETEEHISDLLDIDTILKAEKRFACTVMLEPSFLKILLDKTKTFELTIFTSEEEEISKIIFDIKNL
jgi:8-oxo-dGTP diphosphatase